MQTRAGLFHLKRDGLERIVGAGVVVMGFAAQAAAAEGMDPGRSIQGRIAAVHLERRTPILKVVDADDRVWILTLDPEETASWYQSRFVRLGELEEGQVVAVRPVTRAGRSVAQTIEILAERPESSSSRHLMGPAVASTEYRYVR